MGHGTTIKGYKSWKFVNEGQNRRLRIENGIIELENCSNGRSIELQINSMGVIWAWIISSTQERLSTLQVNLSHYLESSLGREIWKLIDHSN